MMTEREKKAPFPAASDQLVVKDVSEAVYFKPRFSSSSTHQLIRLISA